MPYLVSSIIAIVAALTILLTRYEADDSAIVQELDSTRSMFVMIDDFVNTHIQSGGNLNDINFQKLSCEGILLGNIKDKYVSGNCDNDELTGSVDDNSDDNVLSYGYASTLKFPGSNIYWQLIPIRNPDPSDDNTTNADLGNSAGSGYKIRIDFTKDSILMSKARFSESFLRREFCEKMLFGTSQTNGKTYDGTLSKETFSSDGSDNDGNFVCVVFK